MKNIKKIISELSEDLVKIFPDFCGVYFFGSRLRGQEQAGSDYDMIFLFEHKPDWREKQRARDIVYVKELECGIVIDSHYYAREEIESTSTPFREMVYNEGKFYAV